MTETINETHFGANALHIAASFGKVSFLEYPSLSFFLLHIFPERLFIYSNITDVVSYLQMLGSFLSNLLLNLSTNRVATLIFLLLHSLTCLHFLANTNLNPNPNITVQILNSKSYSESINPNPNSKSNSHATLRYYMQDKPDPNMRDKTGSTPLYLAAACGRLNAFVYLLSQKADVTKADNGYFSLSIFGISAYDIL